jgi:nitrite reductase/ring-hydroxylating ferredoxin subunit
MGFVKVASVSALPEGSMLEITVGDSCYALCNVEGAVHAIAGLCLHRGGPLAEGALHGTTVVCPWHAWEWDCRTGVNMYNPEQRTATYDVKVEGEDILLDVPNA